VILSCIAGLNFLYLSYQAPSNLFTHREFSFTLIGDVYLRYHSFNKVEDLKANVIRLNPTRFEIGAIYTARVREDVCTEETSELKFFLAKR
jgi:DNA primase small subunit